MNQIFRMSALRKCVANIASKLFLGGAFFASFHQAEGANITWIGNVSNDIGNNLNWNPTTEPGPTDTAIFSALAQTVHLSATGSIDFGNFKFTDSVPFTFTFNQTDCTVEQTGMINQGNAKPIFQFSNGFGFDFFNSTTAANAVFNVTSSGSLIFHSHATAANATITVDGPTSILSFFDSSTGGNANVTLKNGGVCNVVSNCTLGSISVDQTSELRVSGPLKVGGNHLSTTLAGTILGSAGNNLTKVGFGTLKLTGSNASSFMGDLIVNQGVLALDGSVGGNVTVNSGGILAGSGSAAGLGTINTGGTIAPNTSTSALLFTGGYTQNFGGVYQVQLDGLGNSSLIVTPNTATLSGTVNVNPENGALIGHPYLILQSGLPIFGLFTAATSSSPFLIPTLTMDPPAAFLLQLSGPSNVFVTLRSNFAGSTSTANQRGVALQLDGITSPTPEQSALLNALVQTGDPATLGAALNQLSGNQYTSQIQRVQTAGHRFIRHLYDPIRLDWLTWDCPTDCCDQGFIGWFEGEGSRSFLESDSNGFGYQMDSYDISGGLYKRITPNWLVGIAFDYERDSTCFNHGGKDRANITQGAFFAAYETSLFYVLSDLIYGYTDSKVTRDIAFTSFASKTCSSPILNNLISYTEAGVNFEWCSLGIQPFIGLEAGYYHRNGFTEGCSDVVALAFKSKSHGNFDSHLGFRLAKSIPSLLTVTVDAAWLHKYTTFGNTAQVHFTNFGNPFNTVGVDQNRDGFDGAVNLLFYPSEQVTLIAQFSGEKWNKFSTFGFTGGIVVTW